MSGPAITCADDIYRFIDILKTTCEKQGASELAHALDNALRMGSSGLEILGAIRQVILSNRSAIEKLIKPEEKSVIEQIITFVDKAYGR